MSSHHYHVENLPYIWVSEFTDMHPRITMSVSFEKLTPEEYEAICATEGAKAAERRQDAVRVYMTRDQAENLLYKLAHALAGIDGRNWKVVAD